MRLSAPPKASRGCGSAVRGVGGGCAWPHHAVHMHRTLLLLPSSPRPSLPRALIDLYYQPRFASSFSIIGPDRPAMRAAGPPRGVLAAPHTGTKEQLYNASPSRQIHKTNKTNKQSQISRSTHTLTLGGKWFAAVLRMPSPKPRPGAFSPSTYPERAQTYV